MTRNNALYLKYSTLSVCLDRTANECILNEHG
uniref:Uncharacterized protein n=1 Tax=Anguilla anguilla TaxID=7936 RepID=A0A0E9SD04_ANGAN